MSNVGLLMPMTFYSLVGFFGYSVYTINTQPNFL